jgi:hypothetical protein
MIDILTIVQWILCGLWGAFVAFCNTDDEEDFWMRIKRQLPSLILGAVVISIIFALLRAR